MRLRGGCVKTPPRAAAAVVCGAKRGRKLALELHLWSARQSGGWLLLPLGLVWGEGGVSGWTGGGGDRRGATTRVEKHLYARVNEATRAREFARGCAARRASSGQKEKRQLCDGNSRKAYLLQCLAWPCGTEYRWARPSRKSPSGGAKEFPLLATPAKWSAPSHRSRSPAAQADPLGPSRNSRPRKATSPPRSDLPVFPSNAESGLDRHGRERDRRRQRGLISLFLQTAGRRRIETHHAQRRQDPSGSVLPPPLPTVAHHHYVFAFVRAACGVSPGPRARAGARGGRRLGSRDTLGNLREPDVANLRRASSGRSPLRCGEVSLRAMRRELYPRRASGLQRSDWLRLSRQEVLWGSSQ